MKLLLRACLRKVILANTINGTNQNGQIGLVIGNVYRYSDKDSMQEIEKLQLQLTSKDQENTFLKEKITSQATEIENLAECRPASVAPKRL
jgi:hypothetical protein